MRGLDELNKALGKAEKETRGKVRERQKRVGEIVRAEAASRFGRVDPRSAAGFRVSVRQRGVSVEQRLKRVTGQRGDYGSLQMTRALVPALQDKADEVVAELAKAVDEIADIVEGN